MLNLELFNILLILLLTGNILMEQEQYRGKRVYVFGFAAILCTVAIFNVINEQFINGSNFWIVSKYLLYYVLVAVTYVLLLAFFEGRNRKTLNNFLLYYSIFYVGVLTLFTCMSWWKLYPAALSQHMVMHPVMFLTVVPIVFLLVSMLIQNRKYLTPPSIIYSLVFLTTAFLLDFFIVQIHLFTMSFTFVLFLIIITSNRQAISYDRTTNALNRYSLEKYLIRNSNKPNGGIVYFLDIDDFKTLNDTYGHHIGDIVLRDVATVIKQNLKNSEKLFRFGGDEFIVIGKDYNKERSLEKQIQKSLNEYNKQTGYNIVVSMGEYKVGEDGNIAKAIRFADIEMYKQKAEHKQTKPGSRKK